VTGRRRPVRPAVGTCSRNGLPGAPRSIRSARKRTRRWRRRAGSADPAGPEAGGRPRPNDRPAGSQQQVQTATLRASWQLMVRQSRKKLQDLGRQSRRRCGETDDEDTFQRSSRAKPRPRLRAEDANGGPVSLYPTSHPTRVICTPQPRPGSGTNNARPGPGFGTTTEWRPPFDIRKAGLYRGPPLPTRPSARIVVAGAGDGAVEMWTRGGLENGSEGWRTESPGDVSIMDDHPDLLLACCG